MSANEATQTTPERYTDEWLLLAEACHFGRGDEHAATYLRRLKTVDQRKRAVNEAHTLMNIRQGRYSDSVWEAVNSLADLISRSMEDTLLYGEKATAEWHAQRKASFRF